MAVLAGVAYAMTGNKPGPLGPAQTPNATSPANHTPSPVATATKAAAVASILVSPATFGCADSGDARLAILLPASVGEDMVVTLEIDGESIGDMALTDKFVQKADGSWSYSDTQSMASLCEQVGSGRHVLHVLDDSSQTLAQGIFTITGTAPTPAPTPKPTPAPTPTPAAAGGGAILVTPALFACSSTTTPVQITIVLGPSVPATAAVAMTIDTQTLGTDTVGTGFEKQSDGTWLASDGVDASSLCKYGDGPHTIKVIDSTKTILAQGVFTTEP